jgi:hypothetical protein
MKLAMKLPHKMWQILIAMILITLFAVAFSQCPTLGFGKYHSTIEQVK